MSTDQGTETHSPFNRPGFIAAAIVIAIIVVLGIVIAIVNATNDDDAQAAPSSSATPTTASTASTEPTTEPSPAAGDASVCGLEGVVDETARLTTAPAVDEWAYEGTTAYPVAREFGPAETSPEGYRYCFQHSPEGAVLMAANAIAYGSDPEASRSWAEYALSQGQYRDELLSQESAPSVGSDTGPGTRISVTGFRLLHYDGETARVDLAVDASTAQGMGTVSFAYELVWDEGDWKFNADKAQPLNAAPIPNSSGYIPWGP